MSGEDPRAGRKTPVDSGRKPTPALPVNLPPPVAPPKPAAPTPRPAAGNNPFLDEAGISPSTRAKKPKPPPGIISAGGVDMARAHASNIQPKPLPDARTPEVPKVVLAVETDPRRVRTGPRLAHSGVVPDSNRRPADKTMESARPPPPPSSSKPAGPSPWASAAAEAAEVVDKKALPSANLPPVEAAPVAEKRKKGTPIWLRILAVLALLFLAFGLFRRFGPPKATKGPIYGPISSSVAVAPPLPDEPTAAVSATEAPVESSAPVAVNPGPAPMPAESASAEPAASADAQVEPSAAAPRPRTTAPPPPKPTFKPLFELPQEKTKE